MIDAQRFLDRMAIAASTMCAVHCLAFPLLAIVVPVLASSALADEAFHRWLLLGVAPTSAVALWLGCRRHGSQIVLVLSIAGLMLISVTAFWGHELAAGFGERAATVVGSLFIAVGHWRNYRLCRNPECVWSRRSDG